MKIYNQENVKFVRCGWYFCCMIFSFPVIIFYIQEKKKRISVINSELHFFGTFPGHRYSLACKNFAYLRYKKCTWKKYRSASKFKVPKLIQWTGHFAIYVRWLFSWRYISSLHIECWRAPRRAKQLSTVAILLYWFLSCWCLETPFFTLVSALQFIVLTSVLFGRSDLL